MNLEGRPALMRFTFYAAGYAVGYLWGRHAGAKAVVSRLAHKVAAW